MEFKKNTKFDYLCNVNIQNEIVQIKFVFEINAHTPVNDDTITTTHEPAKSQLLEEKKGSAND